MEIDNIVEKIKEVRGISKKRKFIQTFDLIFSLQNMDLKKPEHKLDFGVVITTNIKPKKLKICAVVDQSITGAEKVFDKVLYSDDLIKLKSDMPAIRKLTHGFDKFVVQANIMGLFAQVLGRYLGPMNKMPSPKLGMVINSKSVLDQLYDKLQKTIHIQTKKNLIVQVSVGEEKLSDEVIAENIKLVYDNLIHHLPNQKNNLKQSMLKLTMSKGVVF